MVDVARLAGVSQQTVSRVVRGATNVAPDIRERVELAITQLRYRRNPAAAALASNRTMTIGVVSFELSVLGPSVALYGISEEARQHGYSTRLVTLDSLDRSTIRTAFDSVGSDAVDGVVVLAPLYDAIAVLEALDIDVPVVSFQQGTPPSPTSVSIDEVRGARAAVRHLLDLGHETVWHVQGPEGWMASRARRRGWAEELAAAGRVGPPPLETSDWSAAEGYRAGRRLAQMPGVTAVFAANDPFALGVIKALDDAGIDVPGDVSVVGFDDVKEAPYFRPALTTVSLDFEAIGHVAVTRILEMIRGEAHGDIPYIQPQLVVRDTTAKPKR
ncbi:LacI family DNA-binding transcriptional regulator [Agromyces sp. C10]|uniref:LacI family DNA-binding transcriptional regulator n=1 Tax=Agromyces sp. C10 TaxID=2935077 RepID=UPI002009FEA0|nr:substrate-binding domain-containing protein [Agromyces sp. C10]MCK8610061.1 substrate-binding domain-containing protein [Agromyces sp. C10]